MASMYYCVKENNDCPKKNDCKRYIESENEDKTTLFKMACTSVNDYVLFIKHENIIDVNKDTIQDAIDKIINENTKESDT